MSADFIMGALLGGASFFVSYVAARAARQRRERLRGEKAEVPGYRIIHLFRKSQ